MRTGPLAGYKVIELAGIGPGPMCCMLLSDMGAEVVRIDRTVPADLGTKRPNRYDLLNRGRRSVAVDLKKQEGVDVVLRLVERADALVEGFRPGVTEKLGLGPNDCFARNPKLVYGRMTGWGQEGPIAHAAGHDINYISLTGALHAIGPVGQKPVPPLNLVGDFGGGGVFMAFGIVCGLLEASKSGKGQVIDAAMIDGAASLMAAIFGMHAAGIWKDERGKNILDGGAHFYNTYETSDGKYISVGSIEAKFYAELLRLSKLEGQKLPEQLDQSQWPQMQERLTALFKTKTRDEWCAIMEGSDICFAPVLTMGEAPNHPHNKARQTFVTIDGVPHPGPAPRFSRTKPAIQGPPCEPGQHTDETLADWGFGRDEIARLRKTQAVGG